MSESKSLCAKISVNLHAKVSEEKDNSRLTLSEYMEQIISEYYELKEGGKTMAKENIRTLAVQISAELMDRVDAHVEKIGAKKKAWLISIIEKALNDAEKTIEQEI